MESDRSLRNIELEILTYLADKPNAQDTIEGVAEWWLLEQRLRHKTLEVQAALDELVSKKWITMHLQMDGRSLYRLNQGKLPQLQQLLRRKGKK